MRDLYKILGVNRTASEDEIRKAYRTLSKKYHPDANPENQMAEERFKDISEAYAVLQNGEKRRLYDQSLKDSTMGAASQKAGTARKNRRSSSADIDFSNTDKQFFEFFGFHPGDGSKTEVNSSKKNATTNPADMSDLFERYMGFKK